MINSNENINIILDFLKKHQLKLNFKSFLNTLTKALFIGSVFFMLFEVLALFIPIYYAHIYGITALLISLIVAVIFHLLNKVSLKSTAHFLDSFGFKEGLITALENKDNNNMVVSIQRNQVINGIRKNGDSVKYSIYPSYKKILILLGVLLISVGLIFIPTTSKTKAIENHELAREIHEKEKQLEELINDLDKLDKNELTEEDQKALEDLLSALSSSYSEYQNVTTKQQLIAANDRLSYKIEQIENHMTSQELNALLQNHMQPSSPYGYLLSDNNDPNASQDPSGQQNNGNNGANGSNGTDGNNGQNNPNGQMNPQNPNNNSQNPGNNDQNGQGQNGQNQNGDAANSGNGQGQNGDGNDQGQNGDGNDSEDGQGDGNDQGTQNDQSGNGRSDGSSNKQRDYISIPNNLADDPSLTGQGKNKDDNQQFLAGNGLNFEGEHVPYSEVISEYTNQAYDGISQGKYPSNMENVIKDYFSSFN